MIQFVRIKAAGLILASACLGFAASAEAQIVSLTCPGTSTVHYDPGLTNTPRTLQITAQSTMGPCVGVPAEIVSATTFASFSRELSCSLVPALPDPAAILTVNWNDGTHSTARELAVVVDRPLGKTVTVTTYEVTAGRFVGATIVRTFTLLNTQLLGCSSPEGVTDVAGPVVMTVLKVI